MPTVGQQRRRVLEQDAERGHRTRRDEVVRAQALLPGLRASRDDLDVAQAGGRGGAIEERALAPDALHERHVRLGQRHGEDEAREPRSRADIGDAAGVAHHVEVECAQRVGDVDLDPFARVPDRGDRGRLGGDLLQDRPQLRRRGARQAVAQREGGEALPDVGAFHVKRRRAAG